MGNDNIPKVQKALVLQGGGALGAYEAGVFKAFYDTFYRGQEGGPFFDIVAGASIGAVNATILVSHAKNKKTWRGSSDTLHRFWGDISTPGRLSPPVWQPLMGWLDSGFFRQAWSLAAGAREVWNAYWAQFGPLLSKAGYYYYWPAALYFYRPDRLGPLASGDAARRYYAWRQFLALGTPNVLSPGMIQPDAKFLDPSSSLVRFDNSPLARVIEEYWLPSKAIATRLEDGEPRLLFVSVDLESGSTVTFDSYEKKMEVERGGGEAKGQEDEKATKKAGNSSKKMTTMTRRTVYGDDRATKYVIDYPDGLEMKHLMTSMSSHLRFEYPALEARDSGSSNGSGKAHTRHFWDGAYLSNTPLRELLQAHHDYWSKTRGLKEGVPKLQVYIVNLYSGEEKDVPAAPDEIQDRQYDILFQDRTRYDEKVAHIVSDYIGLGNSLKSLAERSISRISDGRARAAMEQELRAILDTRARSSTRDGRDRRYSSLLDGRFEVEVFRVQKLADGRRDIYGKAFDFSATSIKELLSQGESDALAQIKEGRVGW